MFNAIRTFFRPEPARPASTIPAGERVYAIGDIHGRLDLFAEIASLIESDDLERGPADTTVILLGDLIDRGPQSAEVLAGARAWQAYRKVRILLGNHEEMFLLSFEKSAHLRSFLRFGGEETILSYPVDPDAFRRADIAEAQQMMRDVVPPEDLEFIMSFEDSITVGDYAFVHAGIAPDVPIANQRPRDLRWIREPFLSDTRDHGAIVVHGHTITDEPEFRPNRIGIDTGAYKSSRLTALGLQGSERWLIEAVEKDGTVTSTVKPC